jgi:iron complex transport system permease protein
MVGAMAVAALVIAVGRACHDDFSGWSWAVFHGAPEGLPEILLYYTFLPRLAVSLIAGAMLGLSGAIFQQVLRNPLAEPTTLGVSSGAYLATVLATLWWPQSAAAFLEPIALLGGVLAIALVFALAAGSRFSPLSLILAGLIVGLFAGVVTSVLTLFDREALTSAFIWASGSLVQDGWDTAVSLLPRLAAGLIVTGLMIRQLGLLVLDDDGAKALGLKVSAVRVGALLLAVALAASVVSAVGLIGFIGLGAPVLARLAGARTSRQQVLWAPLTGAVLLCLTDQIVQAASSPAIEWPTGIATALVGAPLMLAMLGRLRHIGTPGAAQENGGTRLRNPTPLLLAGAFMLLLAFALVVMIGNGASGWHWLGGNELGLFGPLRWPRVIAAGAAGAMLALAGALMQRVTGNAMASPEVLGISTGAGLGVILGFLFLDDAGGAAQLGSATLGALLALLVMLALGARAAFAPERMLLAGIGLATVFGALVSLLTAMGDPRLSTLLSWMAGSTYHVTAGQAVASASLAAVIAVFSLLPVRWLAVLPLGEHTARSLGVGLGGARLAILLACALATGAATLIVGPLSFVGLMAPHMARMMGLQRPMPLLYGSAVLGALIMVVADWLGRNLLFPYQIPGGLLATLVGGPYFMWQMGRSGQRG